MSIQDELDALNAQLKEHAEAMLPFRPGDKGFTRGGDPYVVFEVDGDTLEGPIGAIVGEYDIVRFESNGQYYAISLSAYDLMPPKQRYYQ